MATFMCHYCVEDFVAPSEYLLLNHIRLVHSTEPGFSIQCTVGGCFRTFRNFRTYQNHKLKHGQEPRIDDENNLLGNQPGFQQPDEPSSSNEIESSFSTDEMQSYVVKWILKTREARSLSRATTDGIIEDVRDLMDVTTQSLKSRLKQVLVSKNVDEDILSVIDYEFSNVKPFDGVMSFHKQLQYCRKHFDFVEPERIVLKETSTFRQCGRKRKVCVKKEEVFYIPLLESLRCLLNNTTVFEEVNNPHVSDNPNILKDYCDGKQFRRIALFRSNKCALQLNLYYDELEICNPLRSRRKIHKLGAFYYMLGNLKPSLRSSTNTIQLLLIAKYTTVVQFGIDRLLEPAIEDIKKLESGVSIALNDSTHFFQGTVTIVSGDNPASAALGGFKQSASAFRFCRHCLGTENDIQSKFLDSDFTIRSSAQHSQHCNVIDLQELTTAERQHFSTTFGVNRHALLDSLQYFSVASGALLLDIMHDVLEGALPYEIKLMLKVFIVDKKRFAIEDIDEWFKNLNIRDFDGDKPASINGVTLTAIDSNLRQHAMQMWTFARFLPVIIGHKIPKDDEHWRNFLCLLEITNIVFAREVTLESIGYLESLISDHHSCFKDLYPHAAVTMKMHSMVHLPRLILKFGPLINHWTARYEAKHKCFKRLSNVMGNFINICYSLALRHQLHQCYLSLNSFTLPNENTEIGPGCSIESSNKIWSPANNSPVLLPSKKYFRANWVKVSGTKYRMPCVLVIGKTDKDEVILILGKSQEF